MAYTCCWAQFVCPAMNQGTFKYRNLSDNQEVSSLKLIHHNFRWDERASINIVLSLETSRNRNPEVSQINSMHSLYRWLVSRIRFTGSVSNPPCGASLSRGWYWTAWVKRQKARKGISVRNGYRSWTKVKPSKRHRKQLCWNWEPIVGRPVGISTETTSLLTVPVSGVKRTGTISWLI